MTIQSFSLLCFLSFWVLDVGHGRRLPIGAAGAAGPRAAPRGRATLPGGNQPQPWPLNGFAQIWGFSEVPALPWALPPPHRSCLGQLWAVFAGHVPRFLPPTLAFFIIIFLNLISQPPAPALGRFARERGRARRTQRQPEPPLPRSAEPSLPVRQGNPRAGLRQRGQVNRCCRGSSASNAGVSTQPTDTCDEFPGPWAAGSSRPAPARSEDAR